MTPTVRFHETERYCIETDRELVRLMATTGLGTWVADCPIDGAAKLRERRKEFKDYVLEHINEIPQEVEFE